MGPMEQISEMEYHGLQGSLMHLVEKPGNSRPHDLNPLRNSSEGITVGHMWWFSVQFVFSNLIHGKLLKFKSHHVWETWQQRQHSGLHDPSEERAVKAVTALSTLPNVCVLN